MTGKHAQADLKTLERWLYAKKSAGKKNTLLKEFVIRLPNGNQDRFYADVGGWGAALWEAKNIEHLEVAITLCDSLQDDLTALNLEKINPMMVDLEQYCSHGSCYEN